MIINTSFHPVLHTSNDKICLELYLPEECEDLNQIYRSDEYDSNIPDLKVSLDINKTITALKIMAEHWQDLNNISIPCHISSDDYEGKIRGTILKVYTFENLLQKGRWSVDFWAAWYNDWSGTTYELYLNSYIIKMLNLKTLPDSIHELIQLLESIHNSELFTLWIGGIKKAVSLSKIEAKRLAIRYSEDGYEDIMIEAEIFR